MHSSTAYSSIQYAVLYIVVLPICHNTPTYIHSGVVQMERGFFPRISNEDEWSATPGFKAAVQIDGQPIIWGGLAFPDIDGGPCSVIWSCP